VNNWNPWCNSNVLAAVLLLEEDENRRVRLIRKIMHSLDRYLSSQHADGGCDEGATYWSVAAGSLFDCLELLYEASDRTITIYEQPLVRRMGQYIVKVFVHDEYYVNFADGSAKPRIDYSLIYRYGMRIGDPAMKALGMYGYKANKEKFEPRNILFIFRELANIAMSQAAEPDDAPSNPYERDNWLEQLQLMSARERSGNHEGLYVAVKGGHNGDSHNHNDVGQFVVYSGGYPFLIDVGVENYSARTFGPGRYDIWTMQSHYHNLPTINGFGQEEGADYSAQDVYYKSEESRATIAMDISGAYPKEAGIRYWNRSITLCREQEAYIQLEEECSFATVPESLILNMVTCCPPSSTAKDQIALTAPDGRQLHIEYKESHLSLKVDTIEVRDTRLQAAWGAVLYRMRFTLNHPTIRSSWKFTFREATQ